MSEQTRLFDKLSRRPSAPAPWDERRANAWLTARLRRGKTERFTEEVNLHPSLASALIELNLNNRAVRGRHVASIVTIIQEGRWKLTHQGIAVSYDDVLMDGQHRLLAVIAANQSVMIAITFGADPSEFTALDGGQTRTASDLLGLQGVGSSTLRASVAAMALRMERRTTSTFDRGLVAQKAAQMQGADIDAAISAAWSLGKLAPPTACVLAYMEILKKSKHVDLLPEFWHQMATGVGQNSDRSPVLRARRYLSEEVLAKGTRERAMRAAAIILLTWKAWVNKKSGPKTWEWSSSFDLPEIP